MANRNSKNYNAIIGIAHGELVVLEDTFSYEGDGLHGATGFIMTTLTQEEIDERSSVKYLMEEYSYLWEEAAQSRKTELGLEDYMKELLESVEDDSDLYFFGDDSSFRLEVDRAIDKLDDECRQKLEEVFGVRGKDFVDWSCSSCGRCIPLDHKEYDVVFNLPLLEAAVKVEKEGVL